MDRKYTLTELYDSVNELIKDIEVLLKSDNISISDRDYLEKQKTKMKQYLKKITTFKNNSASSNAYTMHEIADKFGVSVEMIRQNEKRAIKKLRHPKTSRALRHYLEYGDYTTIT